MAEVTRETVEAIRAKQQNDADEDWLMDFFAARDAVYALLTFIAQQDARLLDQAREIDSIRAERDRLRKYIGEMPYADEWPAVQERLAQQDARIARAKEVADYYRKYDHVSEQTASEQFVAFAKGVNESAKLTNLVMAALQDSSSDFLRFTERHNMARAVVAALREAGYLVDGGEFEYASRDTEDGTIVIPPSGKPIRSWYFEDVRRVVGPWVAVDSGEQE